MGRKNTYTIVEPFETLNLRLPESVKQALIDLAKEDVRSVSGEITWLLVQEIKRRESKKG